MWGSNAVNSKVMMKWENDQFLPPEAAVKYSYDENLHRWNQENIQVQLRPSPIAEGANRMVYCLKDLSLPLAEQHCVGKSSKECLDGRQEPFNEVIMQVKCMKFADEYNSRNPPKRIRFLRPAVLELVQRPFDRTGGKPLMLVEPMLEGVYHKHSNNWGFVDAADRFTPQAFSHFTFVASGGKCLVVDIQGVEDCYTDPQIHSNQPTELPPLFGQGDMAVSGIQKFFETHRCNMICRMLGLANANKNTAEVDLQKNYNASTHQRPLSSALPHKGLETVPATATTTTTKVILGPLNLNLAPTNGTTTSSLISPAPTPLPSNTTTTTTLSALHLTSPPLTTLGSTTTLGTTGSSLAAALALAAASNSTGTTTTTTTTTVIGSTGSSPQSTSPPSSPLVLSYHLSSYPQLSSTTLSTLSSYALPRLPMMSSISTMAQHNPVLVYCR